MTIDLNKLKGIAAFIDQGIQYNRSSPDMPPEPASQWDYEACIVVGEIRAMVSEAERASPAPAVVPESFVWPKPPPRKGQSSDLFEAGYEEGWAKCVDTMQRLLFTPLVAQAPEDPDIPEALELLAAVFDAWENGMDCYEDPNSSAGYLGMAFRLDDDVFHRCCNLLNRRSPPRNAPTHPSPDLQAAQSAAAWENLRADVLHGLDGLDNDQTNTVLGVIDYYMPTAPAADLQAGQDARDGALEEAATAIDYLSYSKGGHEPLIRAAAAIRSLKSSAAMNSKEPK
jgi:hypothetical protein